MVRRYAHYLAPSMVFVASMAHILALDWTLERLGIWGELAQLVVESIISTCGLWLGAEVMGWLHEDHDA